MVKFSGVTRLTLSSTTGVNTRKSACRPTQREDDMETQGGSHHLRAKQRGWHRSFIRCSGREQLFVSGYWGPELCENKVLLLRPPLTTFDGSAQQTNDPGNEGSCQKPTRFLLSLSNYPCGGEFQVLDLHADSKCPSNGWSPGATAWVP